MSLARYVVSFVIVSSALVSTATAFAAAPGTSMSAPRPSASEMRERKLADAKVALKRDELTTARANFADRVGRLATETWRMRPEDRDRDAHRAIGAATGPAGMRSLWTQPNKNTVSSALNTQAVLTAKAVVQAVGPQRAKAQAATMVKSAKDLVGWRVLDKRNLGDAYRYQRAVKDVVALRAKEKP